MAGGSFEWYHLGIEVVLTKSGNAQNTKIHQKLMTKSMRFDYEISKNVKDSTIHRKEKEELFRGSESVMVENNERAVILADIRRHMCVSTHIRQGTRPK